MAPEEVIKAVNKALRYSIYADARYSGSTKVRYGPESEKFYLDWVEGSYESSLQLLIHKIMYHEGLYKKFLNDRCMADVEQVIAEYPDSIYSPDEDDFTEEEEAAGYTYARIQYECLDEIYSKCIFFVGDNLKKAGFDIGSTFADWGVEGEEEDNDDEE